ncbi:unnamed protein product [Urochloa humidicola]
MQLRCYNTCTSCTTVDPAVSVHLGMQRLLLTNASCCCDGLHSAAAKPKCKCRAATPTAQEKHREVELLLESLKSKGNSLRKWNWSGDSPSNEGQLPAPVAACQ